MTALICLNCLFVFQGLGPYAACQSHAFMKGSGTFILGNVYFILFIQPEIPMMSEH